MSRRLFVRQRVLDPSDTVDLLLSQRLHELLLNFVLLVLEDSLDLLKLKPLKTTYELFLIARPPIRSREFA